jgi:hypothetical protein
MGLGADTVDRHTLGLEFLDERNDRVGLRTYLFKVVVVDIFEGELLGVS